MNRLRMEHRASRTCRQEQVPRRHHVVVGLQHPQGFDYGGTPSQDQINNRPLILGQTGSRRLFDDLCLCTAKNKPFSVTPCCGIP